MSRAKPKFTEADITRALKGARKAGFSKAEIKVSQDGSLRVIVGEDLPDPRRSRQSDAEDLLAEWERVHGRH